MRYQTTYHVRIVVRIHDDNDETWSRRLMCHRRVRATTRERAVVAATDNIARMYAKHDVPVSFEQSSLHIGYK